MIVYQPMGLLERMPREVSTLVSGRTVFGRGDVVRRKNIPGLFHIQKLFSDSTLFLERITADSLRSTPKKVIRLTPQPFLVHMSDLTPILETKEKESVRRAYT